MISTLFVVVVCALLLLLLLFSLSVPPPTFPYLLNICFFFFSPNGVTFVAGPGTSEFTKRWNPEPEDIVSFKHRGFLHQSRKPKSPALYRCRPELTWDDIIANWKENRRTTSGQHLPSPFFPFFSLIISNYIHWYPPPSAPPINRPKTGAKLKPRGYWLKQQNVRDFFMLLAKTQGFDPLIPENWTTVPYALLYSIEARRGFFFFFCSFMLSLIFWRLT